MIFHQFLGIGMTVIPLDACILANDVEIHASLETLKNFDFEYHWFEFPEYLFTVIALFQIVAQEWPGRQWPKCDNIDVGFAPVRRSEIFNQRTTA